MRASPRCQRHDSNSFKYLQEQSPYVAVSINAPYTLYGRPQLPKQVAGKALSLMRGQSHKPLSQGQMGIVEDRASGRGELLMAARLKAFVKAGALVLAGGLASDARDLIAAADQATNAFRPARLSR